MMTKTTKTLLALAVICLVSGLAVNGAMRVQADELYVLLPAGAIFFGLFLISKMLEKESAVYDAEQAHSVDLAVRNSARKAVDAEDACGCGRQGLQSGKAMSQSH